MLRELCGNEIAGSAAYVNYVIVCISVYKAPKFNHSKSYIASWSEFKKGNPTHSQTHTYFLLHTRSLKEGKKKKDV